MKTKHLGTIVTILVIVAVIAAVAGILIRNANRTSSSDFIIEDGVLTKYIGDAKNVSIPNTVRMIDSFVFFGHTEIEKVTMADSVTNIGQGAFYGCTNLKSISLSDAVTYIDDGAFGECDSLTAFSVPASVQFIIEGAFYGSDAIREFVVDKDNESFTAVDGVLYTKNMAALVAYPAGCTDANYTVDDSVTYIAAWAFHCADDLKTVVLPSALDAIGEEAFYASGLTSLDLPESLTRIDAGAFYECAALAGEVVIPSGVATVSARAFSGCTALESVSIPGSVTVIGVQAFSGCAALKSANLPKNLTDINENSFEGCTALTLSIPEGSMYIDFAKALGIEYIIEK